MINIFKKFHRFNSRTIIRDINGQNWIQMFYFNNQNPNNYASIVKSSPEYINIYDFNSNSNIRIFTSAINIFVPQALFQKANGLFKNVLSPTSGAIMIIQL